MSDEAKELKVQVKSFLGSERSYWQGGAVRVGLPPKAAEKLNLVKAKGKFILDTGKKKQFLFFETDKGILLKEVDEKTDKRLRELVDTGEGLLGHSLTECELQELIEVLKRKKG